ncbi:MAG: tryptophan--tRNA ligase [SAR324 cluster bacterium]|nr:tryptophan--tRNA ligase [SAR324 cluster bacterium]
MKKIALTGIKPTGAPHIGNYLGAIKPALELAKTHDALYFIADYHALTTVRNKSLLKEQIYSLAATWLAAGLDPDKVTFYRQSDIPEVFELMWILSCMAPKGLLNRAHAYKAATETNNEEGNETDSGIDCGLFYYPILMAADILLFSCHVVPVGQDQKQHLEITRDIAQSFNQTFGKILTLPEPLIQEAVKTIPGIDGRKMSKSYKNEIPLYTTSKKLHKRINQIVTDSKEVNEAKNPDECTLFSIYSQFASAENLEKTRQRYLSGGLGYGELKSELFELVDAFLLEGRTRYDELMADKKQIDIILADGAKKARSIAKPLLDKIRKAIGVQ